MKEKQRKIVQSNLVSLVCASDYCTAMMHSKYRVHQLLPIQNMCAELLTILANKTIFWP